MSNVPDIRKPIIEILKLMEEEPENFREYIGNLLYKNPKNNTTVFEIKTSFMDGYDIKRIEFFKNGLTEGEIDPTQDEKHILQTSCKEIGRFLSDLENERKKRQDEENRNKLDGILKNLRKKK